MKLINKEAQITMIENRINLLRTRNEEANRGIIHKLMREVRKLQSEGQGE